MPKDSRPKLDLFKKSTKNAADRLDFLFGGGSATATIEKPRETPSVPAAEPTKALMPTIFKTRQGTQGMMGLLGTIVFGTLGLFSGLLR